MAAFSVYTGVLYNECFSVPMKIFGASKYVCDPIDPTKDTTCDSQYTTGLVSRDDSAYPFGVDPVWHGTRSELPFFEFSEDENVHLVRRDANDGWDFHVTFESIERR